MASGVTHARVRVSVYTSGTANATLSGTNTQRGHTVVTTVDGGKATYRFTLRGITPIAGLFAVLQGSATKIIRITQVQFSASTATGVVTGIDVSLQRYSAISGGTIASTPAASKNDLNDAAATSVLNQYSVTPTTQTANGGIACAERYGLLTNTVSLPPVKPATFFFGDKPGARNFVLRGASDFMGIVLSAAGTTPVADVWVELTEE